MNALKPRAPFQVLIMSEESRLGREAIETAYALKQLVTAGVRVFFYLEDRERTLDSPTDKIMLSLTTFADEIEREKARQRTRDAMLRKARAGHVTGGWCFGYRNIEVLGIDGQRSHVQREIEPAEADIIRRIFRLSAEGHGLRATAKMLNEQRAPSPRAQRGRSHSWAPTSVREVLHRPLYRSEIVWAQTAKRNKWGQTHQSARPEAEWIRVPAPTLRIVTDEEWNAAHQRITAARAVYVNATKGRPFGRPPLGNPSKYLLTNLAQCYQCGGSLQACSRSHGKTARRRFYGCSAYHDRGRTVCANGRDVSMTEANDIVIEALLDDVLDESMVTDAVQEALRLIQGDDTGDPLAQLDAEAAKVERERTRLVSAIASGGQLSGLIEALQERERQRQALEAQRTSMRAARRLRTSDTARIQSELGDLAESWRRVLASDPDHARPIVSALLIGRVTYTPLDGTRWKLTGEGSLTDLFSKVFSCEISGLR